MDKEKEYLEKYAVNDKVRQLMLCACTGGSEAEFSLWIRDNMGGWVKKSCCHAFVGKADAGRAAENDSKTPLGDFGMICAFGIKPDPGARLPYVAVDEHSWCCGDEAAYNRIIDIRSLPHECKGEHLADFAPEYNYGLFFDYNKQCIPGLGFAIFLHCKGDKPYTGGCIAVDEEYMAEILRTVDKNARLCIYKIPES